MKKKMPVKPAMKEMPPNGPHMMPKEHEAMHGKEPAKAKAKKKAY